MDVRRTADEIKAPKSILLLLVVFGWSLLKGIELLARGSSTADRILYEEVGLGWLAASLLTIIALFDLAAVRYLIKPTPFGQVCLPRVDCTVGRETSIGFVIARANPDVARRAFVVSRESRGLNGQTYARNNLWAMVSERVWPRVRGRTFVAATERVQRYRWAPFSLSSC
jgi:hypothetical protein